MEENKTAVVNIPQLWNQCSGKLCSSPNNVSSRSHFLVTRLLFSHLTLVSPTLFDFNHFILLCVMLSIVLRSPSLYLPWHHFILPLCAWKGLTSHSPFSPIATPLSCFRSKKYSSSSLPHSSFDCLKYIFPFWFPFMVMVSCLLKPYLIFHVAHAFLLCSDLSYPRSHLPSTVPWRNGPGAPSTLHLHQYSLDILMVRTCSTSKTF